LVRKVSRKRGEDDELEGPAGPGSWRQEAHSARQCTTVTDDGSLPYFRKVRRAGGLQEAASTRNGSSTLTACCAASSLTVSSIS
jgi:hypothetical protein